MALVIEAALVAQGFEIAGRADTGAGAVAMAYATKPDLVLMDISLLGEMDGIDAARAIQEGPGSPVVFLTSETDPGMLACAKAVEPHGYLLKPLDPRALRPTIEMALHKFVMEQERQEITKQLRETLAEVERLRGLLPVCAWCRRVRDDQRYWDNLDEYLAKHFSTRYSHGICQDCEARVVAEEVES